MSTSFLQSHKPRAFSLVELIVAMGLFSVVMLLATTAYMSLIDMDRTARARAALINNLSFAVEGMARSIRTGTQYACGDMPNESYGNGQCNSGYFVDCFSFTNQEGKDISYVHKDGAVGRYVGSYPGDRSCTSSTIVPITDPAVHIERLEFFPTGMFSQDGRQASVLILVQGYVDVKRRGGTVRSGFSLQTRATQRQLGI